MCNSSSPKIFYKSTLTVKLSLFSVASPYPSENYCTPSLCAFYLYYRLHITTQICIFSIPSSLFNPPILFTYLFHYSLSSSPSTHIRYPVSILYYFPPHQSPLRYNTHIITSLVINTPNPYTTILNHPPIVSSHLISDISNYLLIRYIVYSLFIVLSFIKLSNP